MPDATFSSFLKNIPHAEKGINHVDKIVSSDKNISSIDINNSSDLQNSGKQTGQNDTNNIQQVVNINARNSEVTNSIQDPKKKEDFEGHTNDIQYLEREISYEEETKLKNALMNHFIFQDLTEEIM